MSKNKTLLDIIGPVMIGPSSSHTAGASRIGYMAGKIFGADVSMNQIGSSCTGSKIKKVDFTLYNSFAKTGFGHGTELALLGGVIGFLPDDIRIKNSFEIAKNMGLEFNFSYKEDFNFHPNAVEISLVGEDESSSINVLGTSVGAGEIVINKINGYKFDLRGDYTTLILIYKDAPGVVYRVTSLIQSQNVNIASMHCDRNAKGQVASMGIALDNEISDYTMQKLSEINDMYLIRKLDKIR